MEKTTTESNSVNICHTLIARLWQRTPEKQILQEESLCGVKVLSNGPCGFTATLFREFNTKVAVMRSKRTCGNDSTYRGCSGGGNARPHHMAQTLGPLQNTNLTLVSSDSVPLT